MSFVICHIIIDTVICHNAFHNASFITPDPKTPNRQSQRAKRQVRIASNSRHQNANTPTRKARNLSSLASRDAASRNHAILGITRYGYLVSISRFRPCSLLPHSRPHMCDWQGVHGAMPRQASSAIRARSLPTLTRCRIAMLKFDGILCGQ